MITVRQERDNIYTVELDVIELHLLMEIAKGYGIPTREALGCCVNKGLDECIAVLKEIAAYETRKREQGENTG